MPRHTDFNALPLDGSFDAVATLAARRCGAGLALVRIALPHGAQDSEDGRSASLSAYNASEIELSRADLDRIATPQTAVAAGMGFFAGVPVRSSAGAVLGLLAVIDPARIEIDEAMLTDLKLMARTISDSIELREEAWRQILARQAEPVFLSRRR